jgi:hypothetical protein
MADPRPAKEVIDQAIRDNRPGEYLCYAFAVVFVLVGTVTIVTGLCTGNYAISLIGTVASGLFWPAMSNARQVRRENIAIRLLEGPLSKAATSKMAAEAIKDTFVNIFKIDGGRNAH